MTETDRAMSLGLRAEDPKSHTLEITMPVACYTTLAMTLKDLSTLNKGNTKSGTDNRQCAVCIEILSTSPVNIKIPTTML